MLEKKDILYSPSVTLTRQDLVEFEHHLKDEIREFLPFKTYSLFFPQSVPGGMAERADHSGLDLVKGLAVHLPEERTVMVPLVLKNEFLGVFVARGVSLAAPKTMLRALPRMATLCLEKLLLYKMSVSDPLTGLASREHFLDAVAQEVAMVRDCLHSAGGPGHDVELPPYRACLGLVLVRVGSLAAVRREHGFATADRVIAGLAQGVQRAAPARALPARFDEDSLAVLLPEATPSACLGLASELRAELAEMTFANELTDQRVEANFSIGAAAFPQDMDGSLFERPSDEQARMLAHKTERAAGVARERGPGAVLAFHQILERGGRVQEALPVGRLIVNLGRSLDAREGQRYLVWPAEALEQDPAAEPDPELCKGEIILMEALEEASLAEVMHQADPSRPIGPGDCLTRIRENHAPDPEAGPGPEIDAVSGLYLYRDFLGLLARAREECDQFCLALVRLGVEGSQPAQRAHVHADTLAAEAAGLAREVLGSLAVGGRFSLNGLVYFHPELDADETLALHTRLAGELRERLGIEAAVGLACHPWLNFPKSACLENCRKALDYAVLLDAPRIGVANSLALNIAADRLFSQGDLYEAVEEYKLALLADEENTLARNSLGICLARLGRLPQARQHFTAVLQRDRRNIMALYNLGYVCQKLGELAEAKAAYRRCLKLAPDHLFSLIRLGQLAETQGNLGLARRYYNRAKAAPGGEATTHRYLARLCVKQDRLLEAREHLHQALIHDPKDAVSLHLLAKLYLDCSEDPEIAEALARQSVALRPEHKQFWLTLARAFETLGKGREAKNALAKAGQL
jgi:tetratricopeptide (TPR) repeat protein/GGDEF domain-containing protein